MRKAKIILMTVSPFALNELNEFHEKIKHYQNKLPKSFSKRCYLYTTEQFQFCVRSGLLNPLNSKKKRNKFSQNFDINSLLQAFGFIIPQIILILIHFHNNTVLNESNCDVCQIPNLDDFKILSVLMVLNYKLALVKIYMTGQLNFGPTLLAIYKNILISFMKQSFIRRSLQTLQSTLVQ